MDDFIDRVAWGVNPVFSNGVGYPPTRWLVRGGARDEPRYKLYLRRHQLPTVCGSSPPTRRCRRATSTTTPRCATGLTGALTEEGAPRLAGTGCKSTCRPLDLADIQGLVVRGYGRLPHAAFLAAPSRRRPARAVLRDGPSRSPPASARPRTRAQHRLHRGGTGRGRAARAMAPTRVRRAVRRRHDDRAPQQAARRRRTAAPGALALGWPDDRPVHVLLMVFALTRATPELGSTSSSARCSRRPRSTSSPARHRRAGRPRALRFQRRHLPAEHRRAARAEHPPTGRAGEFVLGYPNAYGQLAPRPLLDPATDPRACPALPPAPGPPTSVATAATWWCASSPGCRGVQAPPRAHPGAGRHRDLPARLAAKMVGRWPSGAPLVLAPDATPRHRRTPDFGYHAVTPRGWPARSARTSGGPIRATRSSPRRAPSGRCGSTDDTGCCAAAELIHRRQDGRPAERGSTSCASTGTCRGSTSSSSTPGSTTRFQRPVRRDRSAGRPAHGGGAPLSSQASLRSRQHGLPQFVQVRGGAYFFLPGCRALRYLPSLSPSPKSHSVTRQSPGSPARREMATLAPRGVDRAVSTTAARWGWDRLPNPLGLAP